MHYLENEAALAAFTERFRALAFTHDEFDHRAHLAVCFACVAQSSFQEAVFRIKLGILGYNQKFSVPQTAERGYHETITMFFLKVAAKTLADGPGTPLEKLRRFLEKHGDFLPYVHEYYSRPLLNSVRARTEWVEPDLRAL